MRGDAARQTPLATCPRQAVADKRRRRALIRRLLQEEVVSSQDQLASLLESSGVRCTQATLSRDLRDMGVTRERGPNGLRYRLDHRARYMKVLRQVVGMEITAVHHNGAMVVIRTLTGRAEGVAGFLDGWDNPDILGTVAGDDTVFVAPASLDRCDALVDTIQALTLEDAP